MSTSLIIQFSFPILKELFFKMSCCCCYRYMFKEKMVKSKISWCKIKSIKCSTLSGILFPDKVFINNYLNKISTCILISKILQTFWFNLVVDITGILANWSVLLKKDKTIKISCRVKTLNWNLVLNNYSNNVFFYFTSTIYFDILLASLGLKGKIQKNI